MRDDEREQAGERGRDFGGHADVPEVAGRPAYDLRDVCPGECASGFLWVEFHVEPHVAESDLRRASMSCA